MTRRPLNLLTALSLALFATACVLWVRSFVTQDGVELVRGELVARRFSLESWKVWSGWRGELAVSWVYCGEPVYDDEEARQLGWSGENGRWRVAFPDEAGMYSRPDHGLTRWGFGSERHDSTTVPPHSKARGEVSKHWTLMVPWAVPAAVLAALPALRGAAAWRRARRIAAGLCRRCGYDLRATPARCPECGAAASNGARS
jgi:hypothetical protein